MSKDLLLIGSIPLDSVEEVIRMFGAPLGPHLVAMPDGEVGDRRWWTLRLSYQVFHGHPDLETINRPASDDGVERLVPRNAADMWRFKVRPGVDVVRFGDPGWRLGFTKDAINSYFVFKTLRSAGVIPADIRFQVSIPLVNSVVAKVTFPNPDDLPRVRAGYEQALHAEIKTICEKIPPRDLALQWDCSWEITDVYGGIPGEPNEGAIERNIAQMIRLSSAVPAEAMLGCHLCFGTFGGWPRFAPSDLGAAVDLANAIVGSIGRPMNWVSMPTLDRSDAAFYEPLSRLELRGARLYLGMIHNMPSFGERLALTRRFVDDFGISAPCGFGRSPASELPGILQDHLSALQVMQAA